MPDLMPAPPRNAMRPALFLDRDGVINVDQSYVFEVSEFVLINGIETAIRRFNERGWRVFVVTNQSGIARGYYTETDMQTLHDYMIGLLKSMGARIDHIYFCPYHEAGEVERYRRDSELRKPRPGMLLQAMKDYPTDMSQSFLIGDKPSDVQAAQAAGIPGFLYESGDVDAFIEQAYRETVDADPA